MAKTIDWLSLGDDLTLAAYSMLGCAELKVTERGAGDVKILASTLVVRTISNFKSVMLLVKEGMVVEARISARSCLENSFWVGGLVADGHAFSQLMLEDEIKSRLSRGQSLFDGETTRNNIPETSRDRMKTWMAEHRAKYPRARLLNPKDVAVGVEGGEAYAFYGLLSSDAAHPSLSALNRYIRSWDEDEERIRGIDATLEADDDELVETLQFACMAFIGVLIGARQVLEVKFAIEPLADRYLVLTKEKTAEAA